MNSKDFRTLLVNHDFEAAQAAIEGGFSIETTDVRGDTVVEWAMRRGDARIAHWVLDRNPNLDRPVREPSLLVQAQNMADPSVAERLLALTGKEQLNAFDSRGLTPLMRALQRVPRDPARCLALIAQGADVNAVSTRMRDSVLMIALNEKHRSVIPALAAAGADPNLRNEKGQVAAHAAVGTQDLALVTEFLEAFPQADLNQPARSGTPPIMMTMDPQILELMLSHGADANVRSGNTFDGRPTLLITLALSDSTGQIVQLALAKGADPAVADDEGCTAAGHAVRVGHLPALAAMYQAGLSVTEPLDRLGLSPYHRLIHEDGQRLSAFAALFKELNVPVDMGVRPGPIGRLDQRHPSPLFLAIKQGLIEHIHTFIDAGARPDQPGPDGVPALHALGLWGLTLDQANAQAKMRQALIASVKGAEEGDKVAAAQRMDEAQVQRQSGFQDVLALLAKHKINWNATNPEGRTCLDDVARHDLPDVAVALVRLGASPTHQDPDGFTPMDRALHSGSVTTLHAWKTCLDRAGTPWTPDIGEMILNSPEELAPRLAYLRGLESLTACPEWAKWVNAPNAEGHTPLILAAATGQEDVLRLLLAHGAKAQWANAVGETALHHAVAAKMLDGVEHLRTAGARADQPDASGGTPLSWAGGNKELQAALKVAQPRVATWDLSKDMAEHVEQGQRLAQVFPRVEEAEPRRRVRRQP